MLAEYGIRHQKVANFEGDKSDYQMLLKSLTKYLKKPDYSHPKYNSVAAGVLKAVSQSIALPLIYSFNYTDLSTIAAYLGITSGAAVHVHGSLDNDNKILGVGDYFDLSQDTDYMYKVSSLKYYSTNLLYDLDTYDNVLIFGLSLSSVDYPYFAPFFTKIASGLFDQDHKKYIRIFTLNDFSRMEILRNLRGMNRNMIALNNYADFDIIRTENDIDQLKVSDILKKVSEDLIIDMGD